MKPFGVVAGGIVLVVLAVFVWPTRYRYDTIAAGSTARTDRFTGRSELLTGQGWREMRSRATDLPVGSFYYRSKLDPCAEMVVLYQGKLDDEKNSGCSQGSKFELEGDRLSLICLGADEEPDEVVDVVRDGVSLKLMREGEEARVLHGTLAACLRSLSPEEKELYVKRRKWFPDVRTLAEWWVTMEVDEEKRLGRNLTGEEKDRLLEEALARVDAGLEPWPPNPQVVSPSESTSKKPAPNVEAPGDPRIPTAKHGAAGGS